MPRYTVLNTAGMDVRVFLDGAEVKHVIEADTDQGWIMRYKEDSRGRPVIEDGNLVREKAFGDVRVEAVWRNRITQAGPVHAVDTVDL